MANSSHGQISMKRLGVDKTNARIVFITSAAAFLVVFFLIASYSLLSQLTYQNRVIGAKRDAVKQLKANVEASGTLVESYKLFAGDSQNYIGGRTDADGAQDGSNAKITLDALPSKYDFPALTASLEKVANEQKVVILDMAGIDDEVAQSNSVSVANPIPVEIPFQIKMEGDYAAIQRVVDAFERSIRPIHLQTMKVTGDEKSLALELTAKTYYQPEKTLKPQTKVVK